MTKLLSFVLAGFPLLATAQMPFPMEYVDEVGHMGWQDQRASVDLGLATVYHECEGCEANTASDQLRFEGRTDAGNLWQLWIPRVGGLGNTEVYGADFDRNGRADLLVSMNFPLNGRCIDGFDLLFLLFDERGRPAASSITTHGFSGLEAPPAIILDVNGDGRAEVATNQCNYSEYPRHGEDRQITGIYEARDGNWVPLRSAEEAPYKAAAQVGYKKWLSTDADIIWLPMDPSQWPDSPNGIGRFGSHRIELSPE